MSKVIVDTLENTTGTFTSAIDSLGASTDAGAVGTYAFLREDGRNKPQVTFGGTLAGSSLYPASLNIYQSNGPYWGITYLSPTAVSGTWRCMGLYDTDTSKNDEPLTVWVRIS